MIHDSIAELFHDDDFLRLEDFTALVPLFLKVEWLNPSGSIKIKAAIGLIESFEQAGKLGPGGRVIESSSGNLGVALSLECTARNYSFTCVCDPNSSPSNVAMMKALGTEVIIVIERDENGGFLNTRINLIKRMIAADHNLHWLNQYANPANPQAHSRHTATSITKSFARIDYLFVGAGTTGTLMGCVHHFKQHSPTTIIVAVDSLGSVTFGNAPGKRYIPGLGTSRRPEIYQPEGIDRFLMISEEETVAMCHHLSRRYGVLAGGSTGTVLCGVRELARDFTRGATVVAISPDMGERYLETIYSQSWVREKFGDALAGRLWPDKAMVLTAAARG